MNSLMRSTMIFLCLALVACSSPKPMQRYDIGMGDLALPPNLTQIKPSERFRLPDQVLSPTTTSLAGAESALPNDLPAWIEKLSDRASLSGNYRLVLREAPSDLWGRLELFVKQQTQSPDLDSRRDLGWIDSPWKLGAAGAQPKKRYRLRLESLANRVEIYLSIPSIDALGRVSHDGDEVLKALRILLNELFNDASVSDAIKLVKDENKNQFEAKKDSNNTKLALKPMKNNQLEQNSMDKNTIEQSLVLNDVPARAWRKVDLALLRGSFSVEQKNEKDLFFIVRYVDVAQIQKVKDNDLLLKQLFSGDAGLRFKLVLLKEGDDSTRLLVQSPDDATKRLDKAGEILAQIKSFLQ